MGGRVSGQPPGSLFGREDDLAALREIIAKEPLVTLSGTGGAGKTRLAGEFARDPAGLAADAAFVDLSAIRDPSLVLPTIAGAIGVQDSEDHTLRERLIEALSGRSVLLVLDNFEQVIPAAVDVAVLSRSGDGVRIVVTSREPLGLQGEVVYVVEPLPIPTTDAIADLNRLARVPSVALFVERARAARGDFALDERNGPAVAEICARVDGLPLAIELAAARADLLPPATIRSLIEERFDLLNEREGPRPTRQQTLRDLVEWSYALLSVEERKSFRTLSVFARGFTVESAQAVLGSEADLAAVADRLRALCSSSLLRAEESWGEVRFRMLEPVRDHASEALTAGERADAERRHAEHFADVIELLRPQLFGPAQLATLRRMRQELDNVRVALTWSQRVEPPTGLRLVAASSAIWQTEGLIPEGRRWARALLRATRADEPSSARARAMRTAATLADRVGDYAESRELLSEALRIAERLGDGPGVADALAKLGVLANMTGDHNTANELLDRATVTYRRLGDEVGLVGCLIALGELARLRRRLDDATKWYEEARAIADRLEDTRNSGVIRMNLAYVWLARGDARRATRLLQEALHGARDLVNKMSVAEFLAGLAATAAVAGEPRRAAKLAGAAEALFEHMGHHLEPSDRADYDRAIGMARASLADDPFAAASAEGRAMPLEGAVEFALLPPAVEPARDPRVPLTAREVDVARLVGRGMTNRQIATELVLGERTIETHVERIRGKLGLDSRAQLAAWVAEHGLPLTPSSEP